MVSGPRNGDLVEFSNLGNRGVGRVRASEANRVVLPNFVIAGVPKAGTSSLHGWIADHPSALGSVEKETYFLVDPGTHMHNPARHVSNGLEGYSSCFPPLARGRPEPRVVLESTPSYIYSRTALEHLAVLPTRPRVLFILREPASQIYSLYRYFRENWDWIPRGMSFPAYVEAVRAGTNRFRGNELARNALSNAVYADHLGPWFDRLGPDRISVRLFDELLADERAFTVSVARWLGLDPAFYESYGFRRSNETYSVRSPALHWVNLRVRGLLPKGAGYRALRALYRSVNTARAGGPDRDAQRCIERLREEFVPANNRLAAEFGVQVSGWSSSLPLSNAEVKSGRG